MLLIHQKVSLDHSSFDILGNKVNNIMEQIINIFANKNYEVCRIHQRHLRTSNEINRYKVTNNKQYN